MHRYIAFAWNHQIEERQILVQTLVRRLTSTLPEWQCVLATDGLQVYQTGQRTRSCHAYLLKQNIGVVLGKIFMRSAALDCEPHDVAFSEDESQRIKETEGRHLIEHYWGRYVALLREDHGAHFRILRDPTGAMPCQSTNFRGIEVVFSHVGDCEKLGLIHCAINWNHIAAFLWFHRLITKDTGLDGVLQVQAGECVTFDADRTTSIFYWSPDRVHDARIVEDHPQAMSELRTIIQYCVEAWASCYSSILHELSGGLDSAIVLACLSRASGQPRIICQNFYTQSAEGDERAFARQAANLAGIKLFETPLHASDRPLELIVDSTKVASPTLTNLVLESMLVRDKLVRTRDIEAVFSGQGGDHLFQRTSSRLIAAEYASRHGLRPSLLNVIADTSRFTKESIGSVMAAVVISGLLRRHDNPYIQRLKPPPFVSEGTRDALDLSQIRHSWVDRARHLPGIKVLQILNVVDSQNFYHTSSPHTDIVHPLISQPIIEQCLQTPCYVLTYGGIDRALVRDAFSGLMPPEIARRTSKGGTTSYVHRQLARNLPFLREFLLDGVLVGQGMLDRQKTEDNLTESSLIRDSHLLFPILNALRAEIWLRTWIGEMQRAAV